MRQHHLILGTISYIIAMGLLAMLIVAVTTQTTVVVAQATDTAEQSDEEAQVETLDEIETTDVTEQSENTEAETTPATFDFTAQECDAQTYFVRKALILFDKANDSITLSQEAIVYAETNIVQQSNPRLLDIGDKVSVDARLVEDFAQMSQDLTAAEIAAWSAYTGNVDFELEGITPDNDVVDATTPQEEREAAAAAQAEQEAQAAADQAAEEAANAEANDSNDTSPVWWIVGGGAAVGLWYTLWRRNEEN